MNNILDYIAWRGDVPFELSPFNEVDSLILSQLSYLDFANLVDENFSDQVLLSKVAYSFTNASDLDQRTEDLALVNKSTVQLLIAAGNSRRFGNIKVCAYVKSTDHAKEEQFAAITFLLDKKLNYLAFRGTDGSLVGWKEDCNMAFMSPVPAQQSSVEYMTAACAVLKGDIILGGHSKGGNLAVYASAFCLPKDQKRIKAIYNYDGPGFERTIVEKEEFQTILPLICTYMPQSSVVGILFEHYETCVVVESSKNVGVFQHDPFTWFVYGTAFVTVGGLTTDSIFIDLTVKHWLEQLDKDRREQFIDTLFEVLNATHAETLTDLSDSWVKNARLIIKALAHIEPETREAVLQTFHLLFKTAQTTVPTIVELSPHFKNLLS